ncbi:MAG: universal stress protein [Desulfobacterales bacterium]|jgi:nucleotide-binding universal stress UspA family protein
MFKKILYPTDFSDVSQKALDYIKQLKEAGSKSVIVLHVINQRTIDSLGQHAVGGTKVDQWIKTVKEVANQSLMKIEKELKESGFEVKGKIKVGIPLREILQAEEEEDISVIVIGSHGRTNIEEMFLGSVSEKVIRKCKKPVLVIKR